LTTLEPGVLSDLNKLEYLRLNSNNLSKIEANTFRKLANLRALNLRDNSLDRLEKDLFKGLKSLKILNLSLNQMEEIIQETFDHLAPQIEMISLIENKAAIFESYVKLNCLDSQDRYAWSYGNNSYGSIQINNTQYLTDFAQFLQQFPLKPSLDISIFNCQFY
jgi:hypothetical protein